MASLAILLFPERKSEDCFGEKARGKQINHGRPVRRTVQEPSWSREAVRELETRVAVCFPRTDMKNTALVLSTSRCGLVIPIGRRFWEEPSTLAGAVVWATSADLCRRLAATNSHCQFRRAPRSKHRPNAGPYRFGGLDHGGAVSNYFPALT